MIPVRNLRRFTSKALQQPWYASRVLLKRSGAYLHYAFGRGRSVLPEAVTLFLTYRCNLHCRMCGQWGDRGVTRSQEQGHLTDQWSLAKLKTLVDDLAVFNPAITLFGGEPLLFEGCGQLIRHIKQKRMHCLMITNGSLLENYAQEIVSSGLDELNVSLDGQAQTHNEIRGMPGLFERIMLGLAKVNFYKQQAKQNRPLINLQCTITRYNYGQLEQLLEVARTAQADSLTFHNLIFISEEALRAQQPLDRLLGSSSQDWTGFVCEPGIDPQQLSATIGEIRRLAKGMRVDVYPNFSAQELTRYYRDPCYTPPPQNSRCVSPWLVAYIFPDGEVRPCLNSSYSFGNVNQERFVTLWNNARAIGFRRVLKQRRIFPACVRCSELYRY